MRMVSLFLACLACTGHAHTTHKPGVRLKHKQYHQSAERSEPTNALASYLLGFTPMSAFNPSRTATGKTDHSVTVRLASNRRSSAVQMMPALPAGANVLLFGNGPVLCLAARLAAIRGFSTTLLTQGGKNKDEAQQLCFDETNLPESSASLTLLSLSGNDDEKDAIQAAIDNADGIILAFDDSNARVSEGALSVIMPATSKAKHISVMSRYLNGAGMGFWPTSARATTNPDIWNAPAESVSAYKKMESMVRDTASERGASFTVIRAGTLKGGARGEDTGAGEKSFLNRYFYNLGVRDVANWQLIYDLNFLGVEISKGDTLPGPGLGAIITSRQEGGDGDSHRGAVASALVESLRTPAAQNGDFSVKTVKSRDFPSLEEFQAMFEKA